MSTSSDSPFELLNSHIPVPYGTFERLKLYHDLLIKWQNKINLVGKETLNDAWRRHFLDSLQLVKHIDDKNKTIVDLGSGAGFPGMALAIYGYKNIHLIESDSRKVAFLREVARVTDTKVSIHNCRVENVLSCGTRSVSTGSSIKEKYPVQSLCSSQDLILISRACASLEKLLSLIEKSVSHESICLFHKGKNYSIENEVASSKYNYDASVTQSIADLHGVIMKVSNIRKIL